MPSVPEVTQQAIDSKTGSRTPHCRLGVFGFGLGWARLSQRAADAPIGQARAADTYWDFGNPRHIEMLEVDEVD